MRQEKVKSNFFKHSTRNFILLGIKIKEKTFPFWQRSHKQKNEENVSLPMNAKLKMKAKIKIKANIKMKAKTKTKAKLNFEEKLNEDKNMLNNIRYPQLRSM
jgi:hypothetical protein